jgi:hypothetical protein
LGNSLAGFFRFLTSTERIKMVPSIRWSDFALKYSCHLTGNSYTTLEPAQLVTLVQRNWGYRTPGAGEEDRLDRKVLVPIDQLTIDGKPAFFLPPRVPLKMGMPLRAEVLQRQEGEVETVTKKL